MLLFTIILMPLVFMLYSIQHKEVKIIMPAFIGVMTGILVTAFKVFFLYSHRVVPYSISANIIYLILRQSLLPAVLIYGLFFLISKDTREYKINFCFPLLLSFYMIYLPYSIISTSEGLYSFFSLFVKPVVYIVMIYQVSQFLKLLMNEVENKVYAKIALYGCFIFLYLFIPAVLESFVIVEKYVFVIYILSLVYCLSPFIINIAKKKLAKTDY